MLVPDQTMNAAGPIPIKEIKSDGSCSNDVALQIVLRDTRLDEQWMSEKAWNLRWREIDSLYQFSGIESY